MVKVLWEKMAVILLLAVILLSGCAENGNGGGPDAGPAESPPSQARDAAASAIEAELRAAGIDVSSVSVAEGNIEVAYSQEVSEDIESVYSAWALIFGVAVKNAPAEAAESGGESKSQTVTILCNFSDGESMKATADAGNILAFLRDELNTWDFLYSIELEPLTRGPQIPEQ